MYDTGTERWKRTMQDVASILVAAILTVSLFLTLPVMQSFAKATEPPQRPPDPNISTIPLPKEPPEIEVPVKPEDIAPPELDEKDTHPHLDELSLRLDGPGFGPSWYPSFQLQNMAQHLAQEAGNSVFFEELDTSPRPVHQPSPEYPDRLKRQGITGTVSVLFVVDVSGRVSHIKIEETSHRSLAKQVESALKRWKFEPGTRKGRPVSCKMRISFRFGQESSNY